MATSGPTNLPAYFSSSADFQAWVTGIHNALAAVGMIQTADTGQINPATVALPAAGAVAGYEIWRFNDTLQATVPVFFKIEYGGGNPVDRPSLYLTVGSGSNGAGTLTGQVGARNQMVPSSGKAAGVLLPMYVCSDGSDLYLAANIDTASNSFGLFGYVTRPRDNSDTPTNEGVMVGSWNTNNGQQHVQWIPATGSIPGDLVDEFPAVSPAFFARSSGGMNADVCPALMPLGGAWRYARILLHTPTDFPAGGSFQTVIFGATHTFMSLSGTLGNPPWFSNQGNGTQQLAVSMPWE